MIPFFTFFGATFIGKALFKASIQSIFMIGLFNDDVIKVVLNGINRILPSLYTYFVMVLEDQKSKFDRPVGSEIEENGSMIGTLWNGLISLMILYFVIGFLETIANWQIESHAKK